MLRLCPLVMLTAALAGQSADWIEQGRQLIRKQKYAEAVALLNRVKLDNPEDSRAYFYSGLALLEGGNPRQAAPELRRAMELDPSRSEYPLVYAQAQLRLGQKSEAAKTLAAFQQGSRLNELDPGELWLLTGLWFEVEAFEETLAVLNRLQTLEPQSPRVDLKRGEIYLVQGDYDRAAESYRRAADLGSESAAAYGLGVALWKQGRFEEARSQLLRALDSQPDDPQTLYHLGLVAVDLNRPAEAIDYLSRIEHLGDAFPPIYNALARAYRRSGDLDLSRRNFARFQKAQSRLKDEQTAQRRADSLVRRAVEALDSGDARQAQAYFEEALRLQPDQWTARKTLARMHMASRDWASAWDQLSAMQSLRPDDFDIHSLLARYWYERSDPAQARPHGEAARRLNPGDAELRNLLGNIYFSLGLRDEARQEYQAALTLAPEREDFRRNYQSVVKP